MVKFTWELRPVPTPINAASVWEHTPLNPYKGEYPRFIRPVRNERRAEWVKRYADGTAARPGEEKPARGAPQ